LRQKQMNPALVFLNATPRSVNVLPLFGSVRAEVSKPFVAPTRHPFGLSLSKASSGVGLRQAQSDPSIPQGERKKGLRYLSPNGFHLNPNEFHLRLNGLHLRLNGLHVSRADSTSAQSGSGTSEEMKD